MSPLRLHLIRHGETDWNVGGRIQGWSDIPLNAAGERQADALAARFRGAPIGVIVTSDLARARRTADVVGSALGIVPRVDARLRERHLGVLEGVSAAEAGDGDGAAFVARLMSDPDQLPEGAEPLPAFRARVAACIGDLVGRSAAGEVAVVTHGGAIRAALIALTGADGRQIVARLRNCCDVTVEVSGGDRRVVAVEDVGVDAPAGVDEGAAGRR